MTRKAPHRLPTLLAAILLGALIAPAGATAAAGTSNPVNPAAGAGGVPATGAAGTTPAATAPPARTLTAPATTAAAPAGARAATAKTGSGRLSDGALLAAILAGLVALGCLVWAVFRFGAFEPHWLLSLRHSIAEAGFRTSATWAEFSDWIRLGR